MVLVYWYFVTWCDCFLHTFVYLWSY